MASEPHESLAGAAAAYIAGGGNILPSSRGDALELRKQSERLRQWAKEAGKLINYVPPPGPRTGGTEHEVFFHEGKDRVYKRTYPATFGSAPTPRGLRRTATPFFYLVRLELLNRLFDSDIRLEGITDTDEISIVTSQPWAHPADPKGPLPSMAELQRFMIDIGFEPVADSPFEWVSESAGVRVSDARPDNFIKSAKGIVPIDLVISKQ